MGDSGKGSSKRDAARATGADPALSAERATLLTVDESSAGQRLDNFLLRVARGVPKSHVYRIVRSGEVRVNRGRARAEQRLEPGDVVRVPPLRVSVPVERAPAPRVLAPLPILYEDEHLLVVDKPAGLAAHGGSGISHGVIEQLRLARPAQPFLELAHRLDRDTSGVLLLAKSRRALVGLHAALREGRTDKRYLALVVGDWVNDRQHVRAPLAKYLTAEGERRVAVSEDGLASHTVVTLRRRYGALSLVEAQLRTGRTHQIRVHLAHVGFPILGDPKYGDFALNRRAARGEFGARFDRMFLHAASLELAHPVGGGPLRFEAPLPAECNALLEALA